MFTRKCYKDECTVIQKYKCRVYGYFVLSNLQYCVLKESLVIQSLFRTVPYLQLPLTEINTKVFIFKNDVACHCF